MDLIEDAAPMERGGENAMFWWKAAIRGLVLAGVIAGFVTSAAGMTRDEAYAHARWAGMSKDVDFHYSTGTSPHALDGGYIPAGTYCLYIFCQDYDETIGLIQGTAVPDDLALYVLFHEISHAVQSHLGLLGQAPVTLEWEADVMALNMLCAYHKDGPTIMRETYAWVARWENYEGDPTHGDAVQRVMYAIEHAWGCKKDIERP